MSPQPLRSAMLGAEVTERVEVTERQRTDHEHGGHTIHRVVIGYLEGSVMVEVSEDAVRILARKALRNRNGRAQMMNGKIKARVNRKSVREVRHADGLKVEVAR